MNEINLHNVYYLQNGSKVLIDGRTEVGGLVFFRGVTQDGEVLSFNRWGSRQYPGVVKPGKDIVQHVPGEDEENFKVFTVGSLWVTPGDRVWEVVAICRDLCFPIVANKLLPDDNYHDMITRFDWNGNSIDGVHHLWKRVGP